MGKTTTTPSLRPPKRKKSVIFDEMDIEDDPLLNYFTPGHFAKLCYTPWEIPMQGQKPRPMEISNEFFFNTPGNSTFLIAPWISHMFFLQYPRNSMSLTPSPCLDFFWIISSLQ